MWILHYKDKLTLELVEDVLRLWEDRAELKHIDQP